MDFFNKMGQKSEMNALNADISRNQDIIHNMFHEIGKRYYEEHKDDAKLEYEDQFRVIKTAVSNIKLANEKLRILKGVVLCPNCDAENPIGENFCSKCGSRLIPKSEDGVSDANSQNKESVLCTGCQSRIPSGSAFCPVCGKKL